MRKKKKIVPFQEGETVQLVRGVGSRPVQKLKVVKDPGGNSFVTCYSPISKSTRPYRRSSLRKIR